MSLHSIEVTRLESATGPLTKRISMSPEGKLVSDGSACVMSRGHAHRVRLGSVTDFSRLIGNLRSNQAIALGALRPGLLDQVEITTAKRLPADANTSPGTVARTAEYIAYQPRTPAFVLLDYDTKGMPEAVANRLKAEGGFWQALLAVAPELEDAARVTRRSTSSGIARKDTGEVLPGSDGQHIFVLIRDGSDAERFLKALHDRCWLAGLGWQMVGAGGQYLERSIVDRMVYAAERLVFEGPPVLMAPLVQDTVLRAPAAVEGEAIDSRVVCRDLTIVEQAQAKQFKAADRQRIAPGVAASRAEFVKVQGKRIAERTGIAPAAAEQMAARQCGGVLLPGVVLPFDAEDMAGATVADVLADPGRFVGSTLADPLEGEAYGRCKAKIMQRADGSVWINSFAHGRIAYELKQDAKSVEAAIDAADPAEAVNVLARMLVVAEVAADEEQQLRDKAGKLAGVKARAVANRLKAERTGQAQARAEEARDRAAANLGDHRVKLPVPAPDSERVPVIQSLDEVLGAVAEDEPPMRDLDGWPIEVRSRPPMMLHELTPNGANQNEAAESRLPAPLLPLLTKHNRFSLAHLIEHHLAFVQTSEAGGERPVALPPIFVEHYAQYRDSKLPRVGAIVTAPLVMKDGSLLAEQGLDRERNLVFRMEPRLLGMMPAPELRRKQDAAHALAFLVEHWLCDVATDFQGKCVLVSMALTILERVLLPERPAFFVTAGKRGGGKTTALMMVILAVTGLKPAAAAWSSNEEERRKAILAYLAEGLAAVVWDNLPLGATLACPTMEKVLTAETYSDRVLGQTANLTVPAYTVWSFTGNNIAPRGDLASRSLITRLEVDRPDPENREFKHTDPIGWTLANRGAILSALYTLLLSNQQLKKGKAAPLKTRFKTWWHLVGSAIENASATLQEQQTDLEDAAARYASKIDFDKVFASVEREDEEGSHLADVLDVLHRKWPGKAFQGSTVANLINNPMPDEIDDANVLRGFFDAGGRRAGASLSSLLVGKRLAAVKGAPVFVGDHVMRLDSSGDRKAGGKNLAVSFRVHVS